MKTVVTTPMGYAQLAASRNRRLPEVVQFPVPPGVADWSVPCSTTSDVEFVEAPASVALTCDVFEGPATGLASSQ